MNILLYILLEFIEVRELVLLRFHQSISMMRDQGQVMFNLEYPANDWDLAVQGSFMLEMRYTFSFGSIPSPRYDSIYRIFSL
jgi:hypothetical protein